MNIQEANHSDLPFNLNLQYFSGEEDAILPDEPADQPVDTQEDVSSDTIAEEQPEDAKDREEDQPSETDGDQPAPIKIKFNHEEQEIPYDQAAPLIQKGMNYDKLQERVNELEQDPRLSLIQELAEESGMTPDQYIDAVRDQRRQQEIDQLIEQNIPEDIANEILEGRKFRSKYEQKEKEIEQQNKQNEEFQDFIENYPGVDPQKIPQDVWEANRSGVPLKYAYMAYENENLKNQLKVSQKNTENSQKAPINGVTTNGSQSQSSEDAFMRGFNSIK